MKKIMLLSLSALVFAGCTQPAATTTNVNINSSSAATTRTSNDTATVSSHGSSSTVSTAPAGNSNAKSSAPAGNSPMAKAVDVSAMTAEIDKSDKAFKAKPSDAKAKEDLAKAYFVRAFALTDAAQYRSALGDFRRGLKLNPNETDAKAMHDRIISIFESIGREPPKEGEEPPPMPLEK